MVEGAWKHNWLKVEAGQHRIAPGVGVEEVDAGEATEASCELLQVVLRLGVLQGSDGNGDLRQERAGDRGPLGAYLPDDCKLERSEVDADGLDDVLG